MKLARDISAGVLVSVLFVALCTVLPVWSAIAVAVPLMVLLALAQLSEWRERRHAS
jgi:uncharacterized protein (DUF983 family)